MIPLTFHFAFYRGATDWRWRDIHTLCLKSCQQHSGAAKIVVHYDRDDNGPDWDVARALGNIEWRQVNFPTSPDTTDQYILCDLYRLRTLWEEGGFFCDLDFVFLKSFEKFRDATAVIGTQCKQKQRLSYAIVGSMPGSAFVRACLDEYHTSNPWDLVQRHPVTVLGRPAFYPVAYSNTSFWRGGNVCLKNAHAIHLWAKQNPALTVTDLRKTVLSHSVESILGDRPRGVAQLLPGILLSFD